MRLSAITRMKLASSLKELRLHFCPTGDNSAGVREYIAKTIPILIKNNPNLPILLRESRGVIPRLWVRYELGREATIALAGHKARDIQKHVEAFGKESPCPR